MAGYDGFSMSNNAREAYRSGEKPLSKWTKSDILEGIAEVAEDYEIDVDMAVFKPLTKQELAEAVLSVSSWHHTSMIYNKTDFYSVDPEKVARVTPEAVAQIIADRKKEPKQKPAETLVLLEYGEWEGSRKHMKLKTYTDYAIIRGNVAYLPGRKTKRMSGSHVFTRETYSRAPKGTAGIFKEIRNSMPKA